MWLKRSGGKAANFRFAPIRCIASFPITLFSVSKIAFGGVATGMFPGARRPAGKRKSFTRFEDSKGTGKADVASTFYEGWDQNGNDILAGILWHDGKIFATLAPNLWMLREVDNSGHADEVKSLSFGYGVHMSYSGHNMHGLTVGPDGKIYFTIGDKGLKCARPERAKSSIIPFAGRASAVIPTGRELEVFAYGLAQPAGNRFR